MIDLNIYGWNEKLNQLKRESIYKLLSHGRIAIVHRTCYEVISENGLFLCELTRNMMFGKSDFELPCTGVREFGLTAGNPDSLAEMLEISNHSESCRFKDCTHTNEPGCAVLEAVNNGMLDVKVYESYLKLKREAWHFSTSEHEKRKKEKSFSKLIDEVKNRKANL